MQQKWAWHSTIDIESEKWDFLTNYKVKFVTSHEVINITDTFIRFSSFSSQYFIYALTSSDSFDLSHLLVSTFSVKFINFI